MKATVKAAAALMMTAVGLEAAAQAKAEQGISAAEFEKLHALIRPQADEWSWAKVPWLRSLWEARKRAAEEGKPIFIWSMGGEPAGQN